MSSCRPCSPTATTPRSSARRSGRSSRGCSGGCGAGWTSDRWTRCSRSGWARPRCRSRPTCATCTRQLRSGSTTTRPRVSCRSRSCARSSPSFGGRDDPRAPVRFDIRYRTRFGYDAPVSESHNELRACPVTDQFQRLVTYRVGVIPHARPLSFTDYWGTRVDAFGVRLPHRVLEVVAEATVEPSARPPFESDAVLDDLADLEFVSRNHEWLQPTRHTDWNDELMKLAVECAESRGPKVVDAAVGIHDLVR